MRSIHIHVALLAALSTGCGSASQIPTGADDTVDAGEGAETGPASATGQVAQALGSSGSHSDTFTTLITGYLYRSGTQWPSSQSVQIKSGPAAVSWASNRIDVFAVDVNNSMRHFYSGDGGTTAYVDDWGTAPTGYVWDGDPDATSWGSGVVHVLCWAKPVAGGNSVLYQRFWNNGTFSSWTSWGRGGVSMARPLGITVTSWGTGRLDAFTVDTGTSPASLQHLYSANSGGTVYNDNWGSLSGYPIGAVPDATSWGSNRIDVFMIQPTSGGPLVHSSWNGSRVNWDIWSMPFYSYGSMIFPQGPSAVEMGSNNLLVSVIDNSDYMNLWQAYWNGSSVSWTNLGATGAPGQGTAYNGFDMSSW